MPKLEHESSSWSFTASCESPSHPSSILPGRCQMTWIVLPSSLHYHCPLTSLLDHNCGLRAICPTVGTLPILIPKSFVEFLSEYHHHTFACNLEISPYHLCPKLINFMIWLSLGLQPHLLPILVSWFMLRNVFLLFWFLPYTGMHPGEGNDYPLQYAFLGIQWTKESGRL